MTRRPVTFLAGFHLHQPVGNFDHVFEDHVTRVYAPLLDVLERRSAFPATFHISGPLIEWLERHHPAYLDRIGTLAANGRLELLAAGWTEPILAALLPEDRVAQVTHMREELQRRFGVDARGLWLTERVWTPELAADLADAGVRFAIVDDRHFLTTGLAREALHVPFTTEAAHRRLGLFAIDERLRYLIPFRPPAEFGAYIRALHARGAALAVLADDGEKFGGWPGTHDWVYTRGWFDRFCDEVDQLRDAGVLRLATFSAAFAETPGGGLAYLPAASYREMEGWSLPAEAALRLGALERELGEARMAAPEGVLVRGAHWRNFLARYPESNRLHKKAQWLSLLCRERGNPAPVRAAIERAQCNDAYWHGVFGGLYLPHLRGALWRELAEAEEALRRGEPLACRTLDFDFDGLDECWITSAGVSALVSPARGGALEELTRLADRVNACDVLTRRWEAYHAQPAESGGEAHRHDGEGAPSIHELEGQLRLGEAPPVDLDARSSLRERVLPDDVTAEAWAAARYAPVASWTAVPLDCREVAGADEVTLVLTSPEGTPRLRKAVTVRADGTLAVAFEWDPGDGAGWFTSELTLAAPLPLAHDADEEWRAPVETVSKSERGFDRTRQGEGILVRWRRTRGAGTLSLGR